MNPEYKLRQQLDEYLDHLITLDTSKFDQSLSRGRWTYHKKNIRYQEKSTIHAKSTSQKLEKILCVISQDLAKFHDCEIGKGEKEKLATLKQLIQEKIHDYHHKHQGVKGKIYKTISQLFYGNVDKWCQRVIHQIDFLIEKHHIDTTSESPADMDLVLQDNFIENSSSQSKYESEYESDDIDFKPQEVFIEKSPEELEDEREMRNFLAINHLKSKEFDLVAYLLDQHKLEKSEFIESLISDPNVFSEEVKQLSDSIKDKDFFEGYELRRLEKSLQLESFLKEAAEEWDEDRIAAILEQNKIDKSRAREILMPQMKDHGNEISLILENIQSGECVDESEMEELENSLREAAKKSDLDRIAAILNQNTINRSRFIEILAPHLNIHSKEIVQIAEKAGDQQLLNDYVLFFHKKIKRGPDDTLFYDLFNSQAFDELKMLLEKGYPITVNTIDQAFYSHNYACINLVLSCVSDDWLRQNAAHILEKLMSLDEPNINEIVITRFPAIFSHVNLFALLENAISKRHTGFVEWALAHGQKLKLDEIQQLLPSALESCDLKIIKGLCQQIGKADALDASLFYPQILGLDKIKDEKELLERIIAFTLMSPLQDVYELAVLYPSIGKVLPEALDIASLIVRFPHREYPLALGKGYEQVSIYIEKSVAYAQENLKFIQEILPSLSQLTRDELLNVIIVNRYERMEGAKEAYISKQINFPIPTHTPLMAITRKDIHPLTYSVVSDLNRYSWSIRHFANMAFDWDKQKWQISSPSMKYFNQLYQNEIQYYYSFKDSEGQQKKYPLTILSGLLTRWTHSDAMTIKELQPHLEELHKEIIDFPLHSSNQQEFYEKVARGYWLIATLCETHRGTPHNAMMWLNFVYRHHHLPPPIPKIEHFFLDNTMLMIPFEKAIKEWSSFFEPTLDQALTGNSGREQIKTLLKQNGLLLRLCSEKIRGDKELASLAIQQNPAAIQYVSKDLQKELQQILS